MPIMERRVLFGEAEVSERPVGHLKIGVGLDALPATLRHLVTEIRSNR